MKHSNRIVALAGLTMLGAFVQATPCYADAVSFPGTSAQGPMLWIAGLFVVLVSGVSFFLLGRMARRRQAATGVVPGTESHDEN